MFCAVLDRKQAFLDFKNIILMKVAKVTFFQTGKSMVLVKNVKFLHPFFWGKKGLEKVFGIVLDRKEAILDYKNINLIRKLRNWHFSKGVSQMVLFKNLKFLDSFVLGKIDLEKVLCAVLERKQAILDLKPLI